MTDCYTVVIPENAAAADVYITNADGRTLFEYKGKTGTNVYLPSPSDELSSWYFTDNPRVIPSEYGYSVSDDSAPKQGWTFDADATDIFAFVPQGNYKSFASDYIKLTGRSEMTELKMLGMWDSRYYAYTQSEALKQIEDYREHGFQLDVMTIDTDWRSTASGWGYDINTKLFPDMAAFLNKAHELGVNICFNDHPQPVNGTSNLLDKAEVEYRNEMLKNLLELGVDYWWYDRNWSVSLNKIDDEYSRYATGMYAYYEITKDYYESIAESGEAAKRPLIMSNVDGCNNGSYVYPSDLSAHRYSVQWTGDIGSIDRWLQQSIEGAVMAGAELGLPYVSEDIGGHNELPSNDQYTRWFQYGALSPIMRVHCFDRESRGRMPWNYGATAEEVAHTYLDMRYRLLPLFYALAHENYQTGLPIIRRLDIEYPQYVESKNNDEYLLGDYILVAPISSTSGSSISRDVFIPDGNWLDVWTGTRYSGPQTITVKHGIKTSPIFVREGALVALADSDVENIDEKDWSNMSLDIYPSKDYSAAITLYEDDIKSVAYKSGDYRTTDIKMNCEGSKLKVNIGAANGTFSGERAFADRSWNIRLHNNPNFGEILSIKVNGAAVTSQTLAKLTYDKGGRPFAFTGGALDGDMTVFTMNTKVDTAYTIEIEYASADNSGVNAEYDATAVEFTVTAADASQTSLDLTALGTVDWVSYGYNSGTSIDYKKSGPRLFSQPSDRVALNNSAMMSYKGSQIETGINKVYTNGSRRATNNVTGGTKNSVGFEFSVKTTGNDQTVVLYVGGGNTLAKLNVRDRAGNVQTLNIGGIDQANFTRKIEIKIAAGAASTLYFDYMPMAYSVTDQNTASSVVLYCGYTYGDGQ